MRGVRVLLVIAPCLASIAEKKATGSLISPIDNFQASLIASTAHGTTLALQTVLVNNDSKQRAIVLIMHHSGVVEDLCQEGPTLLLGNVKVMAEAKSLGIFGNPGLRDRLSILDRSTIACMTGLASDVDYVTRVLQKGVEKYRAVYDGETLAMSQTMSAYQHVQACSKLMQDSCRMQGSRPFGVQSMFIGRSSFGLDVFTVDTGGSVRHWKRGSAVGRKGFVICKRLSDYEVTEPLETLRVGVKACSEELGSNGRFSAFLLNWDDADNAISIHEICPSQIVPK
jgi:Proteasome subunit